MARQPDLFATAAARYPEHPGYRATDTSLAAAQAVRPKAAWLREKVRAALEEIGPATVPQVAAYLRVAYESIQPRFSELKEKGYIIDSGRRGPSRDPSRQAIVWRVTTDADASKAQGEA